MDNRARDFIMFMWGSGNVILIALTIYFKDVAMNTDGTPLIRLTGFITAVLLAFPIGTLQALFSTAHLKKNGNE